MTDGCDSIMVERRIIDSISSVIPLDVNPIAKVIDGGAKHVPQTIVVFPCWFGLPLHFPPRAPFSAH